jgi:hypothetical protein
MNPLFRSIPFYAPPGFEIPNPPRSDFVGSPTERFAPRNIQAAALAPSVATRWDKGEFVSAIGPAASQLQAVRFPIPDNLPLRKIFWFVNSKLGLTPPAGGTFVSTVGAISFLRAGRVVATLPAEAGKTITSLDAADASAPTRPTTLVNFFSNPTVGSGSDQIHVTLSTVASWSSAQKEVVLSPMVHQVEADELQYDLRALTFTGSNTLDRYRIFVGCLSSTP